MSPIVARFTSSIAKLEQSDSFILGKTELNITRNAIQSMNLNFQTNPKNLVAVLAPCIRPPHYEIDFAKIIQDQAVTSGVLPENFHDCGLCTGSDLNRFYSYRREEGNTGRHLALLGHHSS